METAILFLVFNRPDTTERVFSAVRSARPSRLYVAADGPRIGKEGESERCRRTREIATNVDWPCDVKTLFRDDNLGCKKAVSNAIGWFFENEEEGVVLEDDCLPHPTFFQYCEDLLAYYRDDKRVLMISGDNFQNGMARTSDSYYFSRYTHIWGWASWRRAWQYYDSHASAWPMFRDGDWLKGVVSERSELDYWQSILQKVHDGIIDTWDYQWLLTGWTQGMLTVIPEVNLVSNIGFGDDATHTTGDSQYANMETLPMRFPLRHPGIVLPNRPADAFTARHMFKLPRFRNKINKLRSLIGRNSF